MDWAITVTELNNYVGRLLASDSMLHELSLRGEIGNIKKHSSGHWYFTLKDEKSRIDCVMFRQNNMRVPFDPCQGMKVILKGTVGLYTDGGSYQFYASGMRQEGIGELYEKYEQLKQKLLREGLFDAARKRPLPLLPRAIGVVTSRSGAVIHDIARVAGRRDPAMQLILRPAQVQGEGAAQDIAAGIEELGRTGLVDVIIIGRGGGSLEDLWAFNEEIVARAVAACPVPVVSAVGHETDTTISDLVADQRASTPSMAAEICVPEKSKMIDTVSETENVLTRLLNAKLLTCRAVLSEKEKRLQTYHPLSRVRETRLLAEKYTQRLNMCAADRLSRLKAKMALLGGKLNALGPLDSLQRGYSVAMRNGKAIRSVEEIGTEELTLLLRDGRAVLKPVRIMKGDPFNGGSDI